jgi:cholesterol oxidase
MAAHNNEEDNMNGPASPTPFQFTEDMKGYVTFGQTNYQDGFDQGKRDGNFLMFHLTLKTGDLDRFLTVKEHEADAIGYVECALLGGRCPVERGWFNLFVETADPDRRVMTYRLFFRDAQGQPVTLSGFKQVQDKPGFDVWRDTTTLFTNLFDGHVAHDQEAGKPIKAAGIIHISPVDFMKELTTVRVFAPTFHERAAGVERFAKFFLGSLWAAYGHLPSLKMGKFDREIPLYTTEGVTNCEITHHPFTTGDKLGLSMERFKRADCDDVVVIIHGLTTSTDMFIMPEHYNLVQYLLDNGFTDVWTLDFRMSNRFSYNLHRGRYTMDDIALFDYPAAIATLRTAIGPKPRIHVISHCLGANSFTMSLFGKAVTGIRSCIANSVSLTPRVPKWSRVKLAVAPFACEYIGAVEYVNPYWRREPGFSPGKVLAMVASLFHRECDVPECHMLSFMWGTGFPALYLHENLHDITHRRGGDLYGGTSVHYLRHVRKMVNSNNTAVKYYPDDPKYALLPDNYLQYAAQIETPVLFMTGEQNHVFTDSNILTYERLQKIVPGRHQLATFANYGHQDVFMGKNCHVDIFPRLLKFLDAQRT